MLIIIILYNINMVSALSVTVNMPNIGLIIYYLVCIIILPVILINTQNERLLQLYLSLLLPIAVVLQESGNPNMYQNILIKNNTNSVSIISTFVISLMTMAGILWLSIKISMDNDNMGNGILAGLLITTVIFGFSKIIIPDLIFKTDNYLKEHTDMKESYQMHKYLIGFLFVILICLCILAVQSLYKVDQGDILRRKIKV
jgi:hypothetical protein